MLVRKFTTASKTSLFPTCFIVLTSASVGVWKATCCTPGACSPNPPGPHSQPLFGLSPQFDLLNSGLQFVSMRRIVSAILVLVIGTTSVQGSRAPVFEEQAPAAATLTACRPYESAPFLS